jgi:predicted protein tyrosine phosphatase
MSEKLKILFVCTINRMRSATAHMIYSEDPRFEVRSAGTDRYAHTVLTEELLSWADTVIVMEREHRDFIRQNFSDIYKTKKIVCLYIRDLYSYMQPELVDLLKIKFEDVYNRGFIDIE